jgi:thymidylate synthase
MEIICENNANAIWYEAAKKFYSNDAVSMQNSRNGKTLEIIHIGYSLSDPRQRWIVSRSPAINPAFALAEIIWIVNGRADAEFLNYWNRKLPLYAGDGSEYYGAYGHRLRKNFKFDQLDRAYEVLNANPDSRQVVLQFWDPNRDFPDIDGSPRDTDIPCNIVSLLKIRDNKLDWLQIIRSNDLFLGLPYNIVQFTYLQEILSGWLNIEMGKFDMIADSLYIYNKDHDFLLNSVSIQAKKNLDSVALNKKESDNYFEKLSNQIIRNCTNPIFNQLWNRWTLRFVKW